MRVAYIHCLLTCPRHVQGIGEQDGSYPGTGACKEVGHGAKVSFLRLLGELPLKKLLIGRKPDCRGRRKGQPKPRCKVAFGY